MSYIVFSQKHFEAVLYHSMDPTTEDYMCKF